MRLRRHQTIRSRTVSRKLHRSRTKTRLTTRLSLADAKKDFDSGNVVFVDTRAEVAYKAEHVKGSINIPMEAVETRYKEIPTDKKIIAYCS
jgi:rhodanese-related sulfurtransferase